MLKLSKIISSLLIATALCSCETSWKTPSFKEMFSFKTKPNEEFQAQDIKVPNEPQIVTWLGTYLPSEDREYYLNNTQNTLEIIPVGQTSEWKNPRTNVWGTTTPVRTFKKEGKYCRNFNQTIKTVIQSIEGSGTACRMADGTWELIESKTN